jgi:tRNA(Ile)-lysidine synthase
MKSRFTDEIDAALGRIGIRPGEFILLGLSGGPDSVALLHALIALRDRTGYRIAAAHLNHRLRGEESDRDEAFVRELCATLGANLIVEQAEGLRPGDFNLEERARELRHNFLRRAGDRLGADRIALAHHADDQAETVLMRLLRGAGASGLAGMAEAGPGRLIRPMLSLTREEVLDYLNEAGVRFATDSTNSSFAITRNRVRAQLIPMIERDYAPGLSRRLVELAAEMRSVEGLIGAMAQAELEHTLTADGTLGLSRFAGLHPALAAAVLRAFISRRTGSLRRFGRAHIEAIRRLCLAGPPNGAVDLPGGWRAERQYERLRLGEGRQKESPEFLVALSPRGRTIVGESGWLFDGSIVISTEPAMKPASPFEALFDAEAIAPGLVVRNFIRGDRIQPVGMKGRRKVKEVFIEGKVPRPARARFPLVALNGEVVWIPGFVRGRRALVTDRTSEIVRFSARPPLGGKSGLPEIKHA